MFVMYLSFLVIEANVLLLRNDKLITILVYQAPGSSLSTLGQC